MNDWLRADEAAAWLGVTPGNVRVIAHRLRWRRIRIGRATAYHTDDVADEAHRRANHDRPNHNRVTYGIESGYVHPQTGTPPGEAQR